MPPGYPLDRGGLDALVRGCFAAAAAPRLGEAVWVGGWLKERLMQDLCINICTMLVGFSGPQNQKAISLLETTESDSRF